jgi:hypothetical protein
MSMFVTPSSCGVYKAITTSDTKMLCVWWYTPLIRWVLVRMIGFISSWVTHSLLITRTHRQYSAITQLHTLQFTIAHTLGFSLSTIHLLAIDLDTGIITVSLNHTLQILHIKFSLHGCTLATNSFLHNSQRHAVSYWELTKNYSSPSFILSYKPLIWFAEKQGSSIVASLWKCVTSLRNTPRSCDLSPLFRYPSVYRVA